MKTSSFFHRYKEILLGLFMLALGTFYLYHATLIKVRATVKVSAKLIPEILGIMVLVLGLLQLITGIKYLLEVRRENVANGAATPFFSLGEKKDILPIILTFVLIVGYAFAFEPLGFVFSSVLCMFFQMLILVPSSKRSGKSIVLFFIISLVTALVVFVAFRKGLNLSLPRDPWDLIPI